MQRIGPFNLKRLMVLSPTTTNAVAHGTTGTGDVADACSLPRQTCWWPQ